MGRLFKLSDAGQEPFEVPLLGDVVVTVKPMDTVSRCLCEARARAKLAAEKKRYELAVEEGDDWDGRDLSDEEVCDGLYQLYLIQEVGVEHILSWEGIGNEDGSADLEVNQKNVRSLLRLDPLGAQFYAKMTFAQSMRMLEGNVSGPLPNTNSEQGPNTAGDA